jgi:non-specific serine/threonine protein kinase
MHAMYFVEFCKQAEEKLRHRDQTYWLGRIADEEANIRLALAWCQTEAPDKLAVLARCMYRFWYVRGKFTEGLEWLDVAVDAAESPDARVAPLLRRANLRRHHGDYEGAQRDAEECADLARQQGLVRDLMLALNSLSVLKGATGQFEDARRYSRESMQLAEQLGDFSFVAGSLNNLALVESALGNHRAASDLLERALHEAGKEDDPRPTAVILETAGRIARRSGAFDAARQRYLEGLHISTKIEDLVNTLDILDGLALLALSEGHPSLTLVLIAASSRQREITNSARSPLDESEAQLGAREAKAMLSPTVADSAWQRGLTLNLAEAIAYASGTTGDRASNGAPFLTAREMQVASLIAEGLTNLEIATRLMMAARTADAHVEHIRNKLGLRTRAQIAIWAHDH